MEGPLVEVLARPGEDQHGDDLEDGRRDGEHVDLEAVGEAEVAKGQGEVALDWGCGNVGDEADEEESPERLICPGSLDVLPGGRLVEQSQALGGIVTEDTVDHDHLLALSVPRLAEENARGLGGSRGKVDERLVTSIRILTEGF